MPALESRPGESLPHMFENGSLCLHLEEDWTTDMLLADTLVPWTSEWLIHYEIWRFTGVWYGGGEWPPPRTWRTRQPTTGGIMSESAVADTGPRGRPWILGAC